MKTVVVIGFLLVFSISVAGVKVPSHIPIYPGAGIIAEDQDEDGGTLQLVVQGKPSIIANWYLKELKANGWVQIEKSTGDSEYIEISAYYPKLEHYLLVSIAQGDENEVEIYCEWGHESEGDDGGEEEENGYGEENE